MEPVLLAVVAALLSLAATPLAARLALRLGAVDLPGPRRIHARPTPRLGGVAVASAIAATLALAWVVRAPRVAALFADGPQLAALLAGAFAVLVAGVIDDVRGLSPAAKLLAETIAAAIAVAGGAVVAGVTNPFTGAYLAFGGAGTLLAVCWIVGITNAFNLIDGLDGLAAGVGLITSTTLLAIAWIEGRAEVVPLWAVLAGSLAGFLVYNFAPASIFLGDGGSLLVGYLVALLALQALEKSATVVVVLAAVLALGLPIMDVVLAVARRALAGGVRDVFRADRAHLHHRLVADGGLSHRGAVLVLYAVASVCGVVAIVAALTQSVLDAAVVLAAAAIAATLVRRRAARRAP